MLIIAIFLAVVAQEDILPPLEDDILTDNIHIGTPEEAKEYLKNRHLVTLPTTYDPIADNDPCLPPIMYQGVCGSCYAFAASYVFSYRICKSGVRDSPFAPNVQELVTCDTVNYGCDGGDSTATFRYISRYGIGPSTCKAYENNTATTSGLGACTLNTCDDDSITSIKYFCRKGTATYYRDFELDSVDVLEELIKTEIYTNGAVVSSIITEGSNAIFTGYSTADSGHVFTTPANNEAA